MHSPISSKANIVYRNHSRDRESRDSAYESGVRDMLPSRKSNPPISIHLNTELEHSHGVVGGAGQNSPRLQNRRSSCSTSTSPVETSMSKIDYLNDVLNEPSFLPIQQNKVVKPNRKISLPAMCSSANTNIVSPKYPTKSISVDCDMSKPHSTSPLDWDYNPDWKIYVRDSQFPSQETTL